MSKNVRTQIGKVVGKSLDAYHKRMKPTVDELKFKEQYQGRIIDCMVGEVDNNYIETPLTDENVVKLEHSKEGVIKIPQIKGKTILVDADGNETDTPAEGCRLVSVGEEEDNKLIILSNNSNLVSGMEIGGYSDDGEKLNGISQTQARCMEPIYIGDGGTFYAWMDKNGINDIGTSGVWYHALDKNKQVVRSFNGYSKSYTLNKGEVYIIFRTHMQYSQYVNTFKMMINTSPIIKYVEPQSHKTEILLKEPLREGDYIEGKKIYRNVKQDGLTLIPLEEPIIEELPNSITLQGFDDTTMYIENSITPTVSYGYNALIPYKEELRTQKEEVETNTLDIENNIIPYLMDMEYNLMLMEDN